MENLSLELDQFREKWLAEASAKVDCDHSNTISQKSPETGCRYTPSSVDLSSNSGSLKKFVENNPVGSDTGSDKLSEKEEESATTHPNPRQNKKLITALDYYEQAVKRENEGHLGDSVDLYRKAFRLNHTVDREYKLKYLPPLHLTSAVGEISSRASRLDIAPERHTTDNITHDIKELVASFSGINISTETSDDEILASSRSIAHIPDEVLISILTSLAVIDVASFARVSQVCKKLAYLVATEEQIWKRVCLGSEVGFGAMHYEWQQDILGALSYGQKPPIKNLDQELNCMHQDDLANILLHKKYSSSWCEMFRLRPRIRFNGCYISTVNYLRPGEATPSQISWNSPILIVTYYRYLRFFRDGSVISLLTTSEPLEVVPFLSKECLRSQRNGRGKSNHASGFMRTAVSGRWHLSRYCCSSSNSSNSDNDESDVFLETEGANEKYFYQIKLSLQSTFSKSNACKNNKLAWREFKSFNKLTGEQGDFYLQTEKAFYWSRVKSYRDGN